MKNTITRRDLIPLSKYRPKREEYLPKMINYKNNRRVKLTQHLSLLFENKETVLFQIQELLNSEDLEDPKEIDEYIDIYSGMLPNDNELSATLFIEMDDQEKLQESLVNLKGIEHHLMLVVGSEEIQTVFEEVHDDREFTTSVHYLKIPLTSTVKNLLLEINSSEDVALILNHPNLKEKVTLSPECLNSLKNDLV